MRNILKYMSNQQLAPSQISTLPGIGNLLKRVWQVYKDRFWILLGIGLVPTGLIFVFITSFAILGIASKGVLEDLGLLLILLLLIVFIPIVALSIFWPQVALLYAIKEREERIGIKTAFTKSWPKIISYWWVSTLIIFIPLGGFLLLVIPGIIFAVWFSLALYILVSEERKGMDTLFRSKQLVKGNWWQVFLRFLILGLIVIGIAFPIALVAEVLKIPLIDSIVSLLLRPLFLILGFLIYEDLKRLKSEIPFKLPQRKTKIGLALMGIVGGLLIPGILTSIVLVSLGGARTRARDARIISDMSQLRIEAEILYSSDGSYVNMDKTKGVIKKLSDDITLQGSSLTIEKATDDTAYCAYVKLKTTNQWYCVDSTLTTEETTTNPNSSGNCDGVTFVCP